MKIKAKEEFRILGTDVIVEAGDIIEILESVAVPYHDSDK